MKTFFLILLLVKSPNEIIYVKVPFSYSVEPITCEEIFYEKVKHKFFENDGYYGFYKGGVVAGHFCIDTKGNYYDGYEEKLNWELGHD